MEQNKSEIHKKSIPGGYDLKTDAIEALANDDETKVPTYSKEELEKYRTRSKFHIPEWLKILFIKAWFAGAVCFFILWGLGTYIGGLDMLVVLAVALGMVTDLLTNNVIRFFEKTPGDHNKWMMCPRKGMASFAVNLFYMALVLVCVFLFYNVLNYTIITITGNDDTLPVGVEPILFGLLCMGFDMLFIGMKRMILAMMRDAKAAASGGQK